MNNKVISRLLIIVFGIILGFILLRLSLGIICPSVFAKLAWIILYPVILLRYINNSIVFIGLYIIIWLYVILNRLFVHNHSPLKTCIWTILWMCIIIIPFLPFGIQYFSLLRYNSGIHSYLIRAAPFLGLFIVFIFSNYFYFGQKIVPAVIWAINLATMVISLITFADLLPVLNSQPFFRVLEYRMIIINDLITNVPLIAQLLFIVCGLLFISVIDRYFISSIKPDKHVGHFLVSLGATVIMVLFLLILQVDSHKYRYFDYSNGIHTIYLSKYENSQMIWFREGQVELLSGDFKVLYPFGKFNLRDTLRQHAKQLSKMAIIEGMDYYRLERILRVLQNGSRDTLTYNALYNVMDGRTYILPANLRNLMSGVKARYREGTKELNVTGWITLNNEPLGNIDFYVNKRKDSGSERIWKDKVDSNGKFEFNCFKGLDVLYFYIYFIVPDTIIGSTIEYIRFTNLPNNFYESGNYILDTIKIEIKKSETNEDFKEKISR